MDTIITSEEGKLPEFVRALLVESRPIPPEATFYEQRFTAAGLMKRVAIAALLFLIAAFLLIASLEFLYLHNVDPKYREFVNFKELAAAAAFGFGGWLMLSSVNTGRALSRRQAAGERTRFGVFLLPEALVSHSQFDTTVIPRACFQGVSGGTVNYLLNNVPKSFNLPADWVGASSVSVQQAVAVWGQAGPPSPAA